MRASFNGSYGSRGSSRHSERAVGDLSGGMPTYAISRLGRLSRRCVARSLFGAVIGRCSARFSVVALIRHEHEAAVFEPDSSGIGSVK